MHKNESNSETLHFKDKIKLEKIKHQEDCRAFRIAGINTELLIPKNPHSQIRRRSSQRKRNNKYYRSTL
jgi:hypothetical protein